MNPTLQRHLISAGQTFVTGFGIGILPYLSNLNLASFGKATVFALFLAGIRGGVKLVWENLIQPYIQSKTAVAPATPTDVPQA